MIEYEYFTTFWDDFSIAEHFGKESIEETAKRAFDEWKTDVKYLAELVLIINHKSWYWDAKGNDELMMLYADLYYQYNNLAWDYLEEHGTDEDKDYYFDTLD